MHTKTRVTDKCLYGDRDTLAAWATLTTMAQAKTTSQLHKQHVQWNGLIRSAGRGAYAPRQ